MNDIATVGLIGILPPNLQSDPSYRAAALAIQEELEITNAAVKRMSVFDRIDTLNDAEADEMAWQLHVDFYDVRLPIQQKRSLVKNAYLFHFAKGTPGAVEDLVAILFGSGQVEEWFEYDGERGYFRVRTSDPSATNDKAEEFIKAVNSVKRKSAWLEAVVIEETVHANDLYYGIAVHIGETITIG
ncbi:phage tail protein I [Paenibacillus sp. E222]|uniref:phage tail protein I n=1 Tax=Paenibacillus sp. E222 TaxID=2748863 RepID=UPI0015C65049|nr:phage tail protein I [Paenibacillus sp. E222]QLG39403.1 phage tail protein I [Paenibacillus sp. E222]